MASSEESGTVHGGASSCQLDWISTSVCYLYQDVGVAEGGIYEFSFWVYDDDIWGKARVSLEWLDADTISIAGYYGAYSDDLAAWQQLTTGEHTAPPGAVSARVEIRLYDVSGWPGSATVYVDDSSFQKRLQEGTWNLMTPAASPSARAGHGMAWLQDDQTLLFGGDEERTYDDETWLYDLSDNTWIQMTPATSPSGRWYPAMASLPGHQVILLGGVSIPFFHDTWIYDPSEDTWTQMSPAARPSAREEHAMASLEGDEVLLFGGYDTYGINDETWVYDVSETTWTQMFPATSPSARWDHTMVWLGDDQVLLFGGNTASVGDDDETWVYDLSENTWIQLAPASHPSPRWDHAMVSCAGSDVILFGGRYGDGYQYDGQTWVFHQGGADFIPPEAIDDLSIALERGTKSSTGDMHLQWTEPSDDVWVDRYVIYRSTDPTITGDSLAGTGYTAHVDVGAAGTVGINDFYVVKAVDAAGNKSAASNRVGEADVPLTNELKARGETERRAPR